MPLSLARDFYDRIVKASDPVVVIRGFVGSSPPTFETDWLDFKGQPSSNLNDKGWREIWIKTLAGFANNEGGVVVWGIDARKDPATDIDAAISEVPVDNPQAVKSRLIELQRQATDPPLANVLIEAYDHPNQPGTGFVVCFIPEGPHKPYRAEDGKHSQWYVRVGDNFGILSRSMLQTMFHPRSFAKFDINASFNFGPTSPGSGNLHIALMIVNGGTGTGKDILVHVALGDRITQVSPERKTGEAWEASDERYYHTSKQLNPGSPGLTFVTFSWRLLSLSDGPDFSSEIVNGLDVRFKVSAENQAPQRFTLNVSRDAVLAVVQRTHFLDVLAERDDEA